MAHRICATAESYFDSLAGVIEKLDRSVVDAYAELVFKAWRLRKRVLVFGNGGSAETASHHVADYVKTSAVAGQHRLDARSLVDNKGVLTAIANDISFDDVFSYQLESFAASEDVAVAISCSGNSPNVVKGCAWASANGLQVVAITGFDGGKIGGIADIHINIPSDNYGVIEDIQLSIGHIVAQALCSKVSVLAKEAGGERA